MRKFLTSILLFIAALSNAQNVSVAYPNTAWGAGQYLGIVRYIHPSHTPGTKFPMIIWLHGNGGAQDYNSGSTSAAITSANRLRGIGATEDGIPKRLEDGSDISARAGNNGANPLQRFVVVAPTQDISHDGFVTGINENYVNYALQYMRDSLLNYVDTTRIYIACYSGGGSGGRKYMTNSLANANKIAANVLIAAVGAEPAGGGSWCNIATANLATWWFHAANDGTVGDIASSAAVSTINGTCAASIRALYKHPATGGHSGIVDSALNPSRRYIDASGVSAPTTSMNIYEWMLQYSRDYGGPNTPPVANAGSDQTITLPTSTATLNAGSSFDLDDGIATYQWIKISGPAGGTITTPGPSTGAVSTTITSLQAGGYQYRLIVTDNSGATDDDTVSIVVSSGLPSSNVLTFDLGNHFWPWSSKENPERLFDKSIVEGNRMDNNNQVQFATPVIWFMELKDSVYENIKLRFYNGFGGTQTWKIDFFDSTKTNCGSYTLNQTILPYLGWVTMPGNPDTIVKPIKWIRFETNNALSDVREIEVSGDPVAKVTTLYKTLVSPSVLSDPGVWHIGGSAIEGKDTNYMKLTNGKPLYPSFRHPTGQAVYNARDGYAFNNQPITINRFGDIVNGHLGFTKKHGGKTMMYTTGASMGAKGADLGLTYSSDYNSLAQLNKYKDIIPGSDSTNPASWINTGRFWKGITALWGKNTSAVLPANYVFELSGSQSSAKGQDKLDVVEMTNEEDKNWEGDNGYSSPEVQLAKLRAAWDSVRTVEPNISINMGATIQSDTMRWKSMFFINFWKFDGTRETFPSNGFNMNQYISSAYSGQPHTGNEDAVSPEQFKVREWVQKLGEFRDRFFPGREFRWTEIGFSTSNSDYSVEEKPGIPDSVVAGMLMIRSWERAMCVPNVMTAIYNYFHTSDGSGTFGGMYMVREKFHPVSFSYQGSDRRPLWFMTSMRVNTLWDYKGWSTLLIDGDSTGVNVYRRDHNTDATKKAYTIYKGTYAGSTTSNYVLNVGAATSATLITWAQGNETGVETNLPITAGNITIPTVNEIPAYILVDYSAPVNNKIHRRAGQRWNIIQTP